MIVVYVASPYTIGDKEKNVNRQIDVGDKLMDLGFCPVLPLFAHFHHIRHPRSYEDWIAIDLVKLSRCDILLRLSGESKGATIEEKHAGKEDIPVVYSIEELLKIKDKIKKRLYSAV